jgi:hypothetical protein
LCQTPTSTQFWPFPLRELFRHVTWGRSGVSISHPLFAE